MQKEAVSSKSEWESSRRTALFPLGAKIKKRDHEFKSRTSILDNPSDFTRVVK